MAGIVESLFGPSPMQIQQQQEAALRQRAMQQAQMSNTEAAKYGYSMAGQALARGLTGPSMEEQQAAARQQELAGIDPTDPQSLLAAAQRVSDPQM